MAVIAGEVIPLFLRWVNLGSDEATYFHPDLDFGFLANTHFTDRLIDLSLRWMQPIQQHGRRIPSTSSKTTLLTWSFRVSGVLTETVQQIHSLRASGVMSSHFASAFGEATRAFRKSAGSACAVPEDAFAAMPLVYTSTTKRPLAARPQAYRLRKAGEIIRPNACSTNAHAGQHVFK